MQSDCYPCSHHEICLEALKLIKLALYLQGEYFRMRRSDPRTNETRFAWNDASQSLYDMSEKAMHAASKLLKSGVRDDSHVS